MWNSLFEVIEKVLKTRKSKREYTGNAYISEDQIKKLLPLVKCAPMAGGLDSTYISLFDLKDRRNSKIIYKSVFYQEFILKANFAVCFSSDINILKNKYSEPYLSIFSCQNATIQAYNFQLILHSLNIGSCFVGAIRNDILQKHFDFLKKLNTYAIIIL